MPCCRSVLATAFTSLSTSTKSPVIAALPSVVGWKFITVTTPMAGSNGCPISVIDSARGTVTWKTPAPTSRPWRPRACSICFVSSPGPWEAAAGGAPPVPNGVALADSACRSAFAICTASPCLLHHLPVGIGGARRDRRGDDRDQLEKDDRVLQRVGFHGAVPPFHRACA